MWRGSLRAGRLFAVVLTVLSTGVLWVGALGSVAPALTEDPDTTTTTTPPETTPPETTPPDTTPPDTTPTTTTPPDTSPDSTPTTTTTPDSTTTTTTESGSRTTTSEPDSTTTTTTTEPGKDETDKPVRDTDVYVGSVSTLSPAQRDAIDAFLAATARLAKAQTARAGLDSLSTMNVAAPVTKPDVARDLDHGGPLRLALLDSAVAANRAVFRVAAYAQGAFATRAAENVDAAEQAAAQADAQAQVDAAQADLDTAVNGLRAVANGDPLITALLTGNPPPGDGFAQRIARFQVGQGNPTTLENLFDVPVENAPVASRYGFRIDPLSGNVGFHPGIDISAAQGTPIRAAAAGTVLIADDEGGYGNAVVLDHGNSLSTLYGHMVRVGVTPGQHVEAGDVIGFVGSTGISTGPHVHFEVRVHGVTADPLPTLKH